MNLHPHKDGGSFYESFSDLIFSTLIVFIVLVMGLALEMKDAQQKQTDAEAETAKAEADIKAAEKEADDVAREAERNRRDAGEATRQEENNREAVAAAERDVKRLEEEAKAAKNAVSRILKLNRFTGSSADTVWHYSPIPVDGKLHVWLPPAKLVESFGFSRIENVVDPLLEICRSYKRTQGGEDGLLILTAEEFHGMAGAGNGAFVEAAVRMGRGWYVHLIHHVARTEPTFVASATPQRLRDRLGGYMLGARGRPDPDRWSKDHPSSIPENLHPAFVDFHRWANHPPGVPEDRSGKHWENELLEPWEAAAAATPDPVPGRPTLRFSVTDDRNVRVGRTVLTPARFRCLLRAVKPGRGFSIEYVDAAGKGVEPPAWVLTDLLRPTGMDNHVVDELDVRPAGT